MDSWWVQFDIYAKRDARYLRRANMANYNWVGYASNVSFPKVLAIL